MSTTRSTSLRQKAFSALNAFVRAVFLAGIALIPTVACSPEDSIPLSSDDKRFTLALPNDAPVSVIPSISGAVILTGALASVDAKRINIYLNEHWLTPSAHGLLPTSKSDTRSGSYTIVRNPDETYDLNGNVWVSLNEDGRTYRANFLSEGDRVTLSSVNGGVLVNGKAREGLFTVRNGSLVEEENVAALLANQQYRKAFHRIFGE